MAAIPDNLRVYAFGDIHGRADLLLDLLHIVAEERARLPQKPTHFVFLGDYIDRGPDSAGVIDILISRLPGDVTATFLMGNHEAMLRDALGQASKIPLWLMNGGQAAIDSYRRAAKDAASVRAGLRDLIPPAHRDFLDRLALHHSIGDYLFVHAGIRPGLPLDQQNEQDLLWIREPFLSCTDEFVQVVVHGHTPRGGPEVRPNRIGIDTGAVFTGRLTALRLEGEDLLLMST